MHPPAMGLERYDACCGTGGNKRVTACHSASNCSNFEKRMNVEDY